MTVHRTNGSPEAVRRSSYDRRMGILNGFGVPGLLEQPRGRGRWLAGAVLGMAAAASACGGQADSDDRSGAATTTSEAVEAGVVSTLPALTTSTSSGPEKPDEGPPAAYASLLGKCIDDPDKSAGVDDILTFGAVDCDPSSSSHLQVYAFAFTGVTSLPGRTNEPDEATQDGMNNRTIARCTSEFTRIKGGPQPQSDDDVYISIPDTLSELEMTKGWALCLSRTTFKS